MAKAKPLGELLGDSIAMEEEKEALLQIAQSTVSLTLKEQIQVEAFRVMLSDAAARGICTPGLLMKKREQVQFHIEDCIRFAIAVGNTFDKVTDSND